MLEIYFTGRACEKEERICRDAEAGPQGTYAAATREHSVYVA